MAHGFKTGGGSRKGSPNKATQEIKELLNSNVDYQVVVTKLYELSKGVKVEKGVGDATIVYQEKPDSFAAKILLEYMYGKPLQRIDEQITFADNQKFKIGDQEITF